MSRRMAYVHIGTHKTGTSAFQNWLMVQRLPLLAQGVLVPQTGCGHEGNHGKLARAMTATAEERSYLDDDLLDEFREEVRKNRHDVIISGEYLSGQTGERGLARINSRLNAMGFETRFAVLFRNQFDFINSRYCQRIKRFIDLDDLSANFVDVLKDGNSYRYDERIRRCEQIGLDLKVGTFSGFQENPSIARKIARLLGLEGRFPDDFDYGCRAVNDSFGVIACLAMRKIQENLERKNYVLKRNKKMRLADLIMDMSRSIGDTRYNGFDLSLDAKLVETVHAWNENLAGTLDSGQISELNTSKTVLLKKSPSRIEEADESLRRSAEIFLQQIAERVGTHEVLQTAFGDDVFVV